MGAASARLEAPCVQAKVERADIYTRERERESRPHGPVERGGRGVEKGRGGRGKMRGGTEDRGES